MSHDSWCKVQTVAFVLFFQASVSSQGDSPNRFQPLVLRWKSTSACSAKKVTFRCSIARHDWWRQVMTPMQKPGFRRLLTRFLVVLKDRFFVMFFGIWEDLILDSGHMKYSHAPLCHKEKLSPCHPPSKTAFARRGCRFRAVFLRCWWCTTWPRCSSMPLSAVNFYAKLGRGWDQVIGSRWSMRTFLWTYMNIFIMGCPKKWEFHLYQSSWWFDLLLFWVTPYT